MRRAAGRVAHALGIASAAVLARGLGGGARAGEPAWPEVAISDGDLEATVLLPDARRGFYRGPRFDHSSMIAQVRLGEHTFFGPWRSPHDPLGHDHGVGPAEEFCMAGGLGYDEAPPGGLFMKIGVGLLERNTEEDYFFARGYPVRMPALWTVGRAPGRVEFAHELSDAWGYAYEYAKTVELRGRSLVIRRELRNTGTREIDTTHYCHNIFRMDDVPVGEGYSLALPFEPRKALDQKYRGVARLEGRRLVFEGALGGSFWAQLEGLSGSVSDHAAEVRCERSRTSVRIAGDRPLEKFVVYAERGGLCPEHFVRVRAAPGETFRWSTEYVFGTF